MINKFDNCDLKTFIDIYSKLDSVSPAILKQMVDDRIKYLVNQYNKCPSDVKIKFKKRIELILQHKFNKNSKLAWTNPIDSFIIRKTVAFLSTTGEEKGKLLPVVILLEVELDEAIKSRQQSIKITREFKNAYIMYSSLTEDEKMVIKLWILEYLKQDEEFGKEVIDNYLLPEIDFYEIIKLSKKSIKGKVFLKELLRQIVLSTFTQKNSKVYTIK